MSRTASELWQFAQALRDLKNLDSCLAVFQWKNKHETDINNVALLTQEAIYESMYKQRKPSLENIQEGTMNILRKLLSSIRERSRKLAHEYKDREVLLQADEALVTLIASNPSLLEITTGAKNVEHCLSRMKDLVRVHIRWMIRRDMPEVLQTEQESFEYTWTEDDFLRTLRNRNCIGMVAEQGEKVIGFMIYELHKQKLHILNFAVHPSCRRLHAGMQMVSNLVSKLSSHRRTRISLEVRETNLPAQLFFRSQEFKATRVLRGYYEDSGEDAFLMQYRLQPEDGGDIEGMESILRNRLASAYFPPSKQEHWSHARVL
jgi:ribosomal-protein-alanine N-acetyltransferase